MSDAFGKFHLLYIAVLEGDRIQLRLGEIGKIEIRVIKAAFTGRNPNKVCMENIRTFETAASKFRSRKDSVLNSDVFKSAVKEF